MPTSEEIIDTTTVEDFEATVSEASELTTPHKSGDTLDCIVKSFDPTAGKLEISVKQNPSLTAKAGGWGRVFLLCDNKDFKCIIT